eukprot:CAMPEP_0197666704 /NCGR_PEP_ID=MMETSP1338-20131121/63510_1 /TAXON_ID=43686 ORGANISM="Pelagodinium beii, Strain RCC1491" /NCGR_SAMPLE_ID=MMETSP1338 /ASSEMBLY_ACC=CAM_ASM_000754 /LENGTH=260 /DNA_ID=CAMNT_0043245779 /DNA_START=8 /DNA_END=787 /DNA_ORIENTATION=-
MSMGLDISIPLEELVSVLAQFQAQSSPPAQTALVPLPPRPATQPRKPVFLAPEDSQDSPSEQPKDVQAPPGLVAMETVPLNGPRQLVPVSGPPQHPPQVQAITDGSMWEHLPPPPKAIMQEVASIRVSNLLKGLKSRDIKYIFEKEVGPITRCDVNDCVASVIFGTVEHAQQAVSRFDGGILEIMVDSSKEDANRVNLKPVPWHLTGYTLRQTLEQHVGPLFECHFRRGDAWLTMAQVSKVREQPSTKGKSEYKVDFKGS